MTVQTAERHLIWSREQMKQIKTSRQTKQTQQIRQTSQPRQTRQARSLSRQQPHRQQNLSGNYLEKIITGGILLMTIAIFASLFAYFRPFGLEDISSAARKAQSAVIAQITTFRQKAGSQDAKGKCSDLLLCHPEYNYSHLKYF